MRILFMFGTLSILCTGHPLPVLSQSTAPAIQQAGNCSINITGSGNTATIKCTGVDPKLAEQMKAILNSSRRNEDTAKDISEKLDRLIVGMGVASFGKLKQRCADMAIVISNYALQRDDVLREFPMIRSSEDTYKNWAEGNSQHFYQYLPELERLQKDLGQHSIVDVQFDEVLKLMRGWADVDGKYPEAHNRYLTTTDYIRGIAGLLIKISNEIPH